MNRYGERGRQIWTLGPSIRKGEFRSSVCIKIDGTYAHLIGALRFRCSKYFLRDRQWVNKQKRFTAIQSYMQTTLHTVTLPCGYTLLCQRQCIIRILYPCFASEDSFPYSSLAHQFAPPPFSLFWFIQFLPVPNSKTTSLSKTFI
jgi:hypothetical protein